MGAGTGRGLLLLLLLLLLAHLDEVAAPLHLMPSAVRGGGTKGVSVYFPRPASMRGHGEVWGGWLRVQGGDIGGDVECVLVYEKGGGLVVSKL